MKYRTSSRFTKKISEIGFGAWQLGNDKDFAGMTDEVALELVQKAVEKGITLFDTAPNYALGKSEELLGRALEGTENDIFINTKVGHDHQGNSDFSIKGITKSLQQSVKALRRNSVDSVVLHNPSKEILSGKTEHFAHLINLKKEGLINGFGVSIDTAEELGLVLENVDVDVIEIMFNVIHQSPKVWFDEVKQRDILLIAKIPLDSGWLTGRFDAQSEFTGIRARWTQSDKKMRSEIINQIKRIVPDDDMVSVALSFILSFEAVSSVIPGTRNLAQLTSNVQSLEYNLPQDVKSQLEALYDDKISKLNIPW